MIPILLLAAGASSRMGGRDKLLEEVEGEPLLALLAERALVCGPTFVTLPTKDHPRRSVLPTEIDIVVVDGQMSDSIRAGIDALPEDAEGVIILPADMPYITTTDIQDIQNAARTSGAPIVRATTSDGRAGHPIYFAASEFTNLKSLTGDRGAFRLLKGRDTDIVLVPLDGDRARFDLDTPEDWVAFHAR